MIPKHDPVDPSLPPEEWLEATGQIEEAELAARRIKAYLFTDRFLQYAEEITLLDIVAQAKHATPTAPYTLELSRLSYDGWPDNKGPSGWAIIQRVLDRHHINVVVLDEEEDAARYDT